MPRHLLASALVWVLAAVAVAGCGAGGQSSPESAPAPSRPAPPASEFPSARGKTLEQILDTAHGPSELIVLPAGKVFHAGQNRFAFSIFTKERKQVADAEAALYFAKAPVEKAKRKPGAEAISEAKSKALNAPAVGPYPAEIESLATKPAFRAKTTTEDPHAASVVYVTSVDFPEEGNWRAVALVKVGGQLTGTLIPTAEVGAIKEVPRVGQRAPLIHTPTAADVAGHLGRITTRIPPDTQNRVDYAEVFGRKPIILLFATPKFCQSRVCGPVVDVAEQVKQGYGTKAAFIHMEIYNHNDPNADVRPQVLAFHLPSEPWLFAIDRHGIIRSAIEGAFGVKALTRAVKTVIGE